jgi:sugar lactone lactonase YvrE
LHQIDLAKGPSSHKTIPDLHLRPHKNVNCSHDPNIWLCNGKYGFGLMDKSTGRCKYIARFPTSAAVESQIPNDGACDSRGRFWIGTMADPMDFSKFDGSIWRLDPDLSIHQVVKGGIGVSNGVSWSADEMTMYYTDSLQGKIFAYDYDIETGSIANQRTFWEVEQPKGADAKLVAPDGHAVDVNGCLWIAVYGGSKVVKLDPHGKVIGEIRLPTPNITDVEFAGEDVFITSANDGGEMGGCLFRCHVGVKGRKLNEFQLAPELLNKAEAKL